ncbi:unnamed protein product [Prorocentrum cordatum]|uniref:Arp2/3 complex 34 kDa subunit n=1 Tax=Prorocentrum cordatum TaxID=2364126 RepID=A0ABN9YIJ6_9DINO|nr:unnamed protein product [Polarella glacialis]
MAVGPRLERVVAQLTAGRQARVRVATHPDRAILHIVLLPEISAAMRNGIITLWLKYVVQHLRDLDPPGAGHEPSEQFPFRHATPPALQGRWTTSGFALASPMPLSSVKARCHCTPFLHALIPAL